MSKADSLTVSDVVGAMGGNSPVAERYKALPTSVSNWKRLNQFPRALHLRVERDCRALGIDYDPDPGYHPERVAANRDQPEGRAA